MARSTRAVVARQKSVQTTWLRNAMKSVGISSKNVLKEIAPNMYEATEAGINTSKNVANAIRGARKGNITRTLQNDKYVQFAQKAYRNAISDLKSGKFQNTERMEEAFSGSNLQELAEGFTFGDDGADSSVNVNVIGDSGQTSGAMLALNDTLQRQTETQLKVQKANMDAYVSISAASMQQTGQIGAEIIGHLSSINSNLSAMVQYNNENMNRFIEASLAYYEKVGSSVTAQQNQGNGRISANDILNGRNGGININRYKSYVKQQLKDTVDRSNLGLVKSLLDDQMLDMLASNPLGFLSEGMIRMVAPKILTSTIKSVEDTFSNVVPSALLEVSKWANDPKTGLSGTLKRTIGSIFGISLDKRGTVKGGVSIERGAIPFDGETKHAITEIITKELRTQTSYLEIIASHYKSDAKRYARDNSNHWDWNNNRYTNRKGINRGIAEEYVNSVTNSFSDSNFGKSMRKVMDGRTDQEREYLENALKEVYTMINRYEDDIDIKVLLDIISKTGLTNEAKALLHKHVKNMATKDRHAYDNLNVARIRSRAASEATRRNIGQNASAYGYFDSDFLNVDNTDEEDLLIDEIMGFGSSKRRKRRIRGFRKALDYRDENPNGNHKAGKGPRNFKDIDAFGGSKSPDIKGKFGQYIADTGAYIEGMMRSITQPNGAASFIENLSGLVAKNVGLMGQKVGSILFGDESEGKKGILSDTIDSFKETSKEMFSKVTGALNKGIDSLMDGLIGSKGKTDKDGNLIGRMDRFKNWLFGEKDDKGERLGGVIKKDTQKFFKENKGSIALSTATGAITGGGLLGTLVGGPVAGAIMGMAGSVIKKSNMFQRFLFGSEKNGQKGLFKGISDAWNKSKTAQDKEVEELSSGAKGLLGSIIGAGVGTIGSGLLSHMGILGASLSPLGPIGGAILGLGAGIASQGKTFSEWLFGKEDGLKLADGGTAKEQGVLGQITNALKANFINPLKTRLSYMIDSVAINIEHNVLTPISLVAEAVTEKVGNFVHGIGNSASTLLNKVADRVGKGIETLFSPVASMVSGAVDKVAAAAGATMNTLISLPANTIRAFIHGTDFFNKVKSKVGEFFAPILDPVRDMVHRATDVLTSGIHGILKLGMKGLGNIFSGVTAPVRWLGGLAAAGIRTAGTALKDKLGDRYQEVKLFGADGSIAERFKNSGMTYRKQREQLQKQKEINKRHDKNARFIAKHTKNQFAEDTEEARQYLKQVNPRAYQELMNMYDDNNTSIDKEQHDDQFGASVAKMKADDISKKNVDDLDPEGKQVYYLQGIFNILRGKNWDGTDHEEGEDPILTEQEKAARGDYDDEDLDTSAYTTASRGKNLKEYLRHTKKSLNTFLHGENTLIDSAGNMYSATLGGKYEVLSPDGKYLGTIEKSELPSDAKKAENNDDKASFIGDWKSSLSSFAQDMKRAWNGEPKGGNGGFGDGDDEKSKKEEARLAEMKRRADALAKARDAGITAAESKAKIAEEEEEKESDEQHDAKIKALEKISDVTKEHNKEWSSIFGKTGLITLGILAGMTFLKQKFPELLNGLTNIVKAIGQIGGGAVAEAVDQIMFTEEHKTRTNGNTAAEEVAYLADEMTNGNLFTDKDGNVVGRTDSLLQFGGRRAMNFAFADQVNPLSSKLNKTEKKVYSTIKKGASKLKPGVDKVGQWMKDTVEVAKSTAEFGDEAYELASGKVQKAAAKGINAVKNSSAGKMVSKAVGATDDVLKTVKGYVKEFFKFIQKKLGAKAGKTIGKKAMGEVTEEVIEAGLEKGWKKIGAKIAAKLTSGAAGAALTAGLSEVAFATIGAINGASGTAKLFHVDSSQVDGTMIMISSVFGALAGTTVGGVIDIVFTLLSPILGFDILNNLAVGLYNFLVGGSDSKKAVKLQSAQEAFEGAYIEDRNKDLEKQYKAQLAAGIIGKDVTFDMFVVGIEDGTYSANYTSFDDYNAQKNASFGDKIVSGGAKIVKGIGNGFSAAGDFIFGSKKETFTDSNGNTYVKNQNGMYDVTTSDGKKVGAIAKDAIPKDAKKSVEKSKNIIQKAGDAIGTGWKSFTEGASNIAKDFKAKISETGESISNMGATLMSGFKSMGSSFTDSFKKLSGFGGDLIKDVTSYVGSLKEFADSDEDVAKMKEITIAGAEEDPVRAMISPLINNVMGVYVNITRGVKGIGKTIGNLVGGAVDTIADTLGIDVKGITNKVTKVTDGLKDFGKSAGNWVSNTWNDVKSWGSKTWNSIFGGKGGFGFGGYGTYYSQNDPRWKNAAYNMGADNATMGEAGCGPTAMAMAASDITGRKINPMQMASLAKMTGNRDSTGTNWNFINDSSRALGLSSTQALNPSASYISSELDRGNPVVLSGQTGGYGQSPYTPAGHYVVAVGKDNSGNVIINDPRGRGHSGKYNLNSVAAETGSAWSFGGNGRRRLRGGRGMVSNFRNISGPIAYTDGGGTISSPTLNKLSTGTGVTPADVITIASSEIGYLEKRSNNDLYSPDGNAGDGNYTKYAAEVGHGNGQAWCCTFVSWCFYKACNGDKEKLKKVLYGKDSASCETIRKQMMNAGRYTNTPQAGDLIFFLRDNIPNHAGHIGIVTSVSDGKVYTIEGNTSSKSGVVWNGGCVRDKSYDIGYSSILGYARPLYDGTSSWNGNLSGASISMTGTDTTGMSTWDRLISGLGGFFTEFGSRALSGIMTGDWSNTDYSNIWNGTNTSTGSSNYSSTEVPNVTKAATGAANEANLWKNLNNAIGNKYGTAGLMGNLKQESNLNSKNLQGSYEKKLGMNDDSYTTGVDNGSYNNFVNDSAGYGLAQWTYHSRKQKLLNYAKSINSSIGDQNMQTDFLINELKTGYPHVWSALTSATNVRDASNIVLTQFERPADQGIKEQDERAGDGQSYYNMYANGGYGNRATIGRTRYHRPVPRRTTPRGGRGTVNYGTTGVINSRVSQNQYNNYMNSSNYLTARKSASVNDLLLTVIEILADISGNTKISSDKLDLLRNIQSTGNTVFVGGNSTNNNTSNVFSSASQKTSSRSDISALKIASGSGY